MNAHAFAPAHISGFFEPIYNQTDLYRTGSRGSGMSLTLGATTEIELIDTTTNQIELQINNTLAPAATSQRAIHYLIGDTPLHIKVNTRLDLPIGQGFGMSAAGALSATYALAHLLNLPTEHALKATHCAEVELATGLGDTIAASFGGIEIRRQPGLPPWGVIEHIPGIYDIVLCVIGEALSTKDVLRDPAKMKTITHYGRYCMKKILQYPTIEQLFALSQLFTEKTALATPKVRQAINEANNYGMASMCMLGNSIFAVGDTKKLCTALAPYGPVCVCTVDQYGARIL
jgi:pantoate kinase